MREEVDGRYSANNSGITAGKCDGYERIHGGKKYILDKSTSNLEPPGIPGSASASISNGSLNWKR